MININSLINRNRLGEQTGLPCFCTANEFVIRAIIKYAVAHNAPTVIEATCNQVNQDGGYTGMSPDEFAKWIKALSKEFDLGENNLILGGDHLGPNPWRHLSAEEAMAKAEILVRDYVKAGFRKIHIDTSMACQGDTNLSFKTIAERAARLCKVAEVHAPVPDDLIYIIGTEVPIPGGETDDMDDLAVTTVDRLQDTLDTHRDAFQARGLDSVWPRIVSVVTQPGVDFSHTAIHRFKPDDAADLSKAIAHIPNMTFEAHSTDYQPTEALSELVAKHFFFLKVGPELTFRMREAVFALASIEQQISESPSELIRTITEAMDQNPSHWSSYYQGDAKEIQLLRQYSYSDRIRYYWAVPEVKVALDQLINNLRKSALHETLVSQHFSAREFGNLVASPQELIMDHVQLCVERYYKACGY